MVNQEKVKSELRAKKRCSCLVLNTRPRDTKESETAMRNVLFFASGIVLAAIAFWVGLQLNDETAMVFIGVMLGVVASIPVSVGLLVLLTRDRSAHYGFESTEPRYASGRWEIVEDEPLQLDSGERYLDV